MNIKVTFPKKPANKERLKPDLEHFRNLDKGYRIYFKIGHLPVEGKVTLNKDRVYYGWANKFWGSLVIKETRQVKVNEAKGLDDWDKTAGNFIISDGDTWEELPNPKPYKKGFRGFQYWNE